MMSVGRSVARFDSAGGSPFSYIRLNLGLVEGISDQVLQLKTHLSGVGDIDWWAALVSISAGLRAWLRGFLA